MCIRDRIKGTILSSFFWGYFVLQIPAGQLARTVGPRYLLAGALMFCGIVTIIIPPVALTGSWFAICVARIAQGLGQVSLTFFCLYIICIQLY